MDTGGKRSAGFLHNYDVGVVNRALAGITYRLGLRSILTDTSLEHSEDSSLLSSRVFEPSVDVAYRDQIFDIETGSNGLYSKQGGGADATTFQREDLFGRVGWNPLGLPSVRLSVERIGLRGGDSNSDESETEVNVSHAFGPWRLTYAGTFDSLNDHTDDADRTIQEHIGRLDYQEDLDEKGTNLGMGVLVDRTQRHDNTAEGNGGLPALSPVAGLFAIDTTPLMGALSEIPALVDGNVTSSTGINIGSSLQGGGTDRNLGVDLGTPLELQGMRVYTDAAVSTTDVPFFQWSVYRSDDNQSWFLVTLSAAFTYNTFLRRFDISFQPTTTRFLKVVNVAVPPAANALFVTDITPLGSGRGTGSPNSSRRVDTAHATIRVFPTQDFDVTASVLVGKTTQEDFGIQTRDEDRLDLALAGHYQPHPDWDLTLSGSTDRQNDPITTDRVQNTGSGLVSFRPWTGLETSLSGSHRVEMENGELDTRTSSGGVRVGIEASPELSTSLDVTRTISRDVDAGTLTKQWSIAELLFAKLTREWQLNFDVRWDQAEVSGNTDTGSPSQYVINPELIYRPGPYLIASTDEEYRGGDGPSGWFHRFRLDWLPFPDGTVNVEINYALQAIPAPARETRQGLQTRVQWNLTERSYFEFLGTDQRTTQGSGNRVQTLQLTYNITF